MKREYSVMFPLFCDNGEWKIVFELRSKDLSAHKGEISLPGGAVEAGESRRDAAVRETSEELGIACDTIRVIDKIEGTRTLGGSLIHCYIAQLSVSNFSPSRAEVEKLLLIPLQHLLQHPQSEEMLKSPMGEWVKSYRYDFENHTIWGITGRLIKNFVDSFERIRQKIAEKSMTGKSEAN